MDPWPENNYCLDAIKSARKPENVDQYPQIRVNEWTAGLIFKNSFWLVYLSFGL